MSLTTTNLAFEVLRPGDDGYDTAARMFYSTGRPAVVVRPRDPDEIAAALLAPYVTTWRWQFARAGTARSATAATLAGW